jgi:hypothetical protein|tara:strand:+ start:430 stop:729 length:300 start_codon:yes stop_codon:yes gene_type:complete
MSKCLVHKDGSIATDKPLFFCEWNSNQFAIHTRESLYSVYKDSNLYDKDSDWKWGGELMDFNTLLDHLSLPDEDALEESYGRVVSEIYYNDNMSIQRIY